MKEAVNNQVDKIRYSVLVSSCQAMFDGRIKEVRDGKDGIHRHKCDFRGDPGYCYVPTPSSPPLPFHGITHWGKGRGAGWSARVPGSELTALGVTSQWFCPHW